jgi:hypothetical protein
MTSKPYRAARIQAANVDIFGLDIKNPRMHFSASRGLGRYYFGYDGW